MVLSVINYTDEASQQRQTNLLKLERVQNEAIRVILGISKDTPSEIIVFTNASQTESGAGQSILQCRRKSPQPTSRSRERHKGMQDGMQVLNGSSRALDTVGMPADRAQANQRVGKIPKPIPASLCQKTW